MRTNFITLCRLIDNRMNFTYLGESSDDDVDYYRLSIQYLIKNMVYALNVNNQIQMMIGAKNVISKILVVGLVEMSMLINLFKNHN
jgi:hypothetical protein